MNLDQLFKEAIERYPKSNDYKYQTNVTRELMQYCVLSALAQTDFFDKASFLGGTSLRLCRGLDRFSEDLDFSLLTPNKSFQWGEYVNRMQKTLEEWRLAVDINDKTKADVSVKKAEIKSNDALRKSSWAWGMRTTGTPPKVMIKLEVDSNPPPLAKYEKHNITWPNKDVKSIITLQDITSTFAGKSHALLSRGHIKGRDWYDFVWYTEMGIVPNYEHLTASMKQMGDLPPNAPSIDGKTYTKLLQNKIATFDATSVALIQDEAISFALDKNSYVAKSLLGNTVKTLLEHVDKFEQYALKQERNVKNTRCAADCLLER